MFRFFKINDPYRLIVIFVLALLIKLPFFINNSAYFAMHHWLTVGEAMQSGRLYLHIFDSLAPLASFAYWLVVLLFGKSVLALHISGTLLMVIQAIIFNNLTINNKVYEQNTYLPAFVYLIFSSVHYSLSVFSPAQLGMTFILLAFGRLLAHVEFRAKRDEQIMGIGLLIGVAALFFLPYIVFLPIVWLILLLFTNTLRRRYIILMITAVLPLLVSLTYYWLVLDSIGYYIRNFIVPSLAVTLPAGDQLWQHFGLFLPLLLGWLLGLLTMPKQRRLNNYQYRLVQLFFVTGVLSLFILTFTVADVATGLTLLVPVAAFFATHLFYLVKRPLTDLLVSLLFVALCLLISYDSAFAVAGWANKIANKTKVAQELVALIKGKRIMVLGDKPQLYQYGALATPFYNWALARPVVDNLTYYDNLVFIQESVDRYQPEVIIDYDFKWRRFVYHLPELARQYKQVRPFVWVSKK